MKARKFRFCRLGIPFRLPISHNLARHRQTAALVVVVEDDEGQRGYGEGTPREFVTGETLPAVHDAARRLGDMMIGQHIGNFNELLDVLRHIAATRIARTNPSAWCALETACLDLWARRQAVPLWRLFREAPARENFVYSAVLPLLDPVSFSARLEQVKRYAMPAVKLKIDDARTGAAAVREARRHLGKDVSIRVDANGAFNVETALTFLEDAETCGLSAFEQPVKGDDVSGMGMVAANRHAVPVIADESVCAMEDLSRLAAARACHGINIRLSKCGGFLNSLELAEQAGRHDLFYQIGCHVGETAILSAAGRHLGAVLGGSRYLEGSFSRFVLEEDLSVEDIAFGPRGEAPLLSGPGLGVTVDEGLLERYGEFV